jgi:hypothetical protein
VTGLIVGRWVVVVGMEWERMLVEFGFGRVVGMLIVVAVVVEQMRMMFDLC